MPACLALSAASTGAERLGDVLVARKAQGLDVLLVEEVPVGRAVRAVAGEALPLLKERLVRRLLVEPPGYVIVAAEAEPLPPLLERDDGPVVHRGMHLVAGEAVRELERPVQPLGELDALVAAQARGLLRVLEAGMLLADLGVEEDASRRDEEQEP
jgi:hypothetical protein